MALLGLDVGTTGCKAIVYGERGDILASRYREYSTISENGLSEIDPAMVWESVKAVLEGAAGEAGERVTALGVSTFGESAVPVDREGNILGNAMLYTDPRGKEECEILDRYREITRLSAHPMFTLSKILWQRAHQPALFARVWKYLLMEDFILFRLTGNCCISYSEASRTGGFDVEKKCFCRELFDEAGLSIDLFSAPVPSGTVCGTVWGIPGLEGAAAVTGGHDQVCSALGAGAVSPGLAVCGTGTVECITAVFDQPLRGTGLTDRGYCCTPHGVPGLYVTCAYNYTGGGLLKWFRDNLADTGSQGVYRAYDRAVEDTHTDLLLLPHFAGAATPYMDVNARGAILGLSAATTRADIYRAILEGCSFEMLLNLRLLEEQGIVIRELSATGGGAASPVWLQIKADVFGFPVRGLASSEAGTAGAAMLAGAATGAYADLNQAAGQLVRYGTAYLPNPARREEYSQKFARYRKIYDAIKTI